MLPEVIDTKITKSVRSTCRRREYPYRLQLFRVGLASAIQVLAECDEDAAIAQGLPNLFRSVQHIARPAVDHIPAANLLGVPHTGRVPTISSGVRWNKSILYREHGGDRAQ